MTRGNAVSNQISYATDKDLTEIGTVTRVTFSGLRSQSDLLMERASTVEVSASALTEEINVFGKVFWDVCEVWRANPH